MYFPAAFAWNDKNSARTKTLLLSHASNFCKRFSPFPPLWLREAFFELNVSRFHGSFNGRFLTKGDHTASNVL
jgi:hypothetical protein